ncbi:MAG: GAF domain-containing protein [Variovorax sp.]
MSQNTFIRVIEYWVPSEDGHLLEFGGGLFGSAKRFAAISRPLCFGRGEGLPGQVWDSGRPIVLKELDGNYFRRADAARAEGLPCGIAMPIFTLDQLSAVVVIFCGDDHAHAGAIELWANDPKESRDMTLVDGYYGTTGDTFEFISRSTSFRVGYGLPGMAWKRQAPVFLADLGKGSGFIRADSAVKVGINRGFSLPCSTIDGTNYVLAFLSALATPIARRVEIWEPDEARAQLHRTYGFSDPDGELAQTPSIALGEAGGPVGQAFRRGVPSVAEPMIAIPVAPGGVVTAVIALHF